MKKKYRNILIVISSSLALLLLAGILFLYLKGFRITYAPELETSWNAVSAFAAWGSVIVSLLAVISSLIAIFYAIRVPKEIADRQNRIALFDKRLEFYNCLLKCDVFKLAVSQAENVETMRLYFLMAFDEKQTGDISQMTIMDDAIIRLYSVQQVLKTGAFLFDFETEKWIYPLRNALNSIVMLEPNECTNFDFSSKKLEYTRVMLAIEDGFLDQIRNSLKL